MGKRGPKPWAPSEQEVAKIRLYAGLGMTQEQCAKLVGISCPTFRAQPDAKAAFEEGKAETIAKVAGSLVKKALGGDTTSAIFYLKTQAGWKETNVSELVTREPVRFIRAEEPPALEDKSGDA